MAVIEIDGEKYDVEEGKNLLDACLNLGLDLPYFCWHPSLGSVGSCRQCAIRVYANPEDERGRILMGCMTPVSDGMRISLNEKTVEEFRDHSIEVTMANHPHDCPVCEEGGECHLQDMTIMSNHTERKYRGKKKTYNNQYLGSCISHEMNRCITCYRCVRFYDDYAGGKDLVALSSRENTYFGRHEDGCLESVFSGNLAEVCPTGVFTDKTLARSYNRKWDLQSAPSICTGCSLGCNISPGERHGKIKRVLNRYHGEINGYFICDKGRFGYDHNNHQDRISAGEVNGEKVSIKDSILEAVKLFSETTPECLLGIGSERASVEENYLLKEFVGDSNFYSGVSDSSQNIVSEIRHILEHESTDVASLKDIEDCDAVLVLGEDLMNSAPRMAMSIRQATRQKSFDMAKEARIPLWQDSSVRILAQNERSPLVIVSGKESELDGIASQSIRLSPEETAKLGFGIAHNLDATTTLPDEFSGELSDVASSIAKILQSAKNPLIVSGVSSNNIQVVQAAGLIAQGLSNKTKVSFVLPANNSMGLNLVGGRHLSDLIENVTCSPGKYTVVVLQNDLYRHASPQQVDALLDSCRSVVIIDHVVHRTSKKSHVLIPASKVMETEGTLVNNEGRAQRYFPVYSSEAPNIQDNWKTIIELSTYSSTTLKNIKDFDDVVTHLSSLGGIYDKWSEVAPDSKFRIAGMKMPRQMHRYSGRTSLKAHEKVSESKQPEDRGSALSFSMEGAPIERPPAVNALIWSPGWNSNEAINKFQDEIGGALTGGDPGVRSIEENSNTAKLSYEYKNAKSCAVVAVSHSRIFDGCEFSFQSIALAQRCEKRTLLVSRKTAQNHSISHGQKGSVHVEGIDLELPIEVSDSIPNGVVSIPDDIFTREILPAAMLPAKAELSGI